MLKRESSIHGRPPAHSQNFAADRILVWLACHGASARRWESLREVCPVAASVLKTSVKAKSPDFEKNHRRIIDLLTKIKNEEEQIRQGGGAQAVESQHKKGRLTVRERIAKLIDPGSQFFELGLFAAYEMYQEWGGAPSAGTITGLAKVCGRTLMLIANDATVKAGAFFPMTAKKVIRAQNIAIDNHIPTIYLVDSAGIFLPLQEDVFPDTDDFGRVFRNNAVMSAMGIPQLAAIMGMCVAGGAYLPLMCDHILMTDGSGLFLAGPALVQAAIGQVTSAEDLGGAKMHSQISGTVDFREPDDDACIARIRSLVDKMGAANPSPFSHVAAREPLFPGDEIYGIFSSDPAKQYDMREIIARIVDASEFEEYRAEYGETVLCGYGRIGGWVSAEILSGQPNATIQQVLPRRSRFVRKVAGKQIAEQVIVANIDVALVVAALDGDFSVRRIERYLAQSWESGARPAIVLNKADACAEPQELVAQIERIAMGVPIFLVSAKTGAGLEAIEASFKKGQTIVLLGSSGVGKSTLVNRLLQEERQPTHAVRSSDSRGRHTTTSRELFVTPGGALIIDTPGLRELQLWNAAEGVSQTFTDVDELAAQCRFTDCQHLNEPGCAVQRALAEEVLDADRLESWRKLQREQGFLLRKMDPANAAAQKKGTKISMRQVREKYRNRDKGKN